MSVRIELLASGDELVRGRTRDTNSPWMAERLTAEGFDVVGIRTVGDDVRSVTDALRRACGRADAVVMTGGLGPTADDLTRDALAALLKAPLEEHAGTLRRMRARWRARGLKMPDTNRVQALIPAGARALRNDVGSARRRASASSIATRPGSAFPECLGRWSISSRRTSCRR
ncbi:MAG: molybdopterin-binding protein [Planctomycetota bacterium]|jgi:nicotinamide-nucleotide amidase